MGELSQTEYGVRWVVGFPRVRCTLLVRVCTVRIFNISLFRIRLVSIYKTFRSMGQDYLTVSMKNALAGIMIYFVFRAIAFALLSTKSPSPDLDRLFQYSIWPHLKDIRVGVTSFMSPAKSHYVCRTLFYIFCFTNFSN